jgi:hypothetical protein
MTEQTVVSEPAPMRSGWRWKLALVLVLGLTMIVLVIRHTPSVNGPWWWTWPWRRLSWSIYPLMVGAAVPFFAGHWLYARGRLAARGALALVMLSTLCIQLTAMSMQPLGLRRLPAIVQNSVNTSYYNAAEVLVEQMEQEGKSYRDWMEIYPELMDVLMLHAAYKPPGLIFYYIVMIKLFGAGQGAALAGGLLIALLACASVAATYALIRFFSGMEQAALLGASFFALTPSLVLFLPQFDQAYPVLVCLLLIAWAKALRVGGRPYAVAFGTLFALMLFLTPTFLMLGVFLASYTLLHIADHGRRGLIRAVERSIIVTVTIALLYLLLWAATGFDPLRTFTTAAGRSQAHLVSLMRPWPLHSLFDLLDIALGTGWISVPLAASGAAVVWRMNDWRNPSFRLVYLGLLQVGMAVAVALFPGENARLMLPMMPLLMAPIGIELSQWPSGARLTVYLMLVLITAAICQNMIFLYMGIEIEGVPKL